ncbi:hypothetical protein [Brachybacterium sp.]|uniref:hypothetical protein n=1 Tax=Brachybacterium sp. TaxID=1891286 RepID=UPI002ED1E518
MALKVEQNGVTLVVNRPSHSSVSALEHLGWEVVEGTKPEPPSAPEPEDPQGSGDGVPRGNASREVWAEYAASLGIEVPEDAKRDDIKVLVEQHEAE